MLRHAFAHPQGLWLLAALAVLAVLVLWGERRRWRALAKVGSARELAAPLARRSRRRRRAFLALFPGMVLLGLAAAGPQWGRDWEQSAAPGRDLIVVVDCSRSMLAETPSRLERAQLAAADLVAQVRRRGGHRLGLVLFAGRPRLVCPLTQDYDHFASALEMIPGAAHDPDLAPGPREASGTRIGLALHAALRARDEHSPGVCDILLISDGDDPAGDSEWRFGVIEAQTQEVPVHVLGLGNPDEASVIWVRDKPLPGKDGPVRSRMDLGVLREIAQAAGGQLIDARARSVPLGTVYLDLIAERAIREESVDALPVYRQRTTWALLPAFGLLVLGLAIGKEEG